MNSLISQLRLDYPQFSFLSSNTFAWSSEQQTIFIDINSTNAKVYILHELAHAILSHQTYRRDIDLVKLERDAWDYAHQTLSPKYQIPIEENIPQDNLDTYREWMHARSTCPNCHATGLQVQKQEYKCIACAHRWKVNEARLCALRRYSINTK